MQATAPTMTDCRRAALAPMGKVGRPREHDPRMLRNAIQYIATTACQWAQLPKKFPPFTTVQYHFCRMRDSGLLDLINEMLVVLIRLAQAASLSRRLPLSIASRSRRRKLVAVRL